MTGNVQEVAALFDTAGELEHAAEELMSSGFDRSRISILDTERAVLARFGDRRVCMTELIDDPRAPRLAYVDHHDLAVGQGMLVGGLFYVAGAIATIVGIASGAHTTSAIMAGVLTGVIGAALGWRVARHLGQETSRKIEGERRKGGLPLWVHTYSDDDVERAATVLARHGAHSVRRHGDGQDLTRFA